MPPSSSEIAAGVRAGDLLAGKYLIDRVLGAGGMGVVVAAHHIHLDEKVAIKFLLPEALDNAEAVARFAREARAAAKIKSQHVARVIDVGTLETGAPYIVMEYLEGGDLAAWIQRQGALSIEDAVEFVLQACEAIADAHGLGIVHRDLKPANLFWVRGTDGLLSIKVLDFGISKVTGLSISGSDMGMTKTTAVMGSPFYMSPEQMQSSRNVDARADIWAIGIILYELLAGRPPFGGETLPEVCLNVSTKPPPPLRTVRPDAPARLEAVILKCLEKDRERRFANVAELGFALADFGPKRSRASVDRINRVIQNAGLSTSALNLPTSSDPQPGGAGTLASWGQTHGGPKGRAGLFIGLGALVLVLLGVGTVVWMKRASGGPTTELPTALVSQGALPQTTPPTTAIAAAPEPEKTPPPAPPPSPVTISSTQSSAPAAVAVPIEPPRGIVFPRKPVVPVKPVPVAPLAPVVATPPRPSKPETKPAAPATNAGDLGGRL